MNNIVDLRNVTIPCVFGVDGTNNLLDYIAYARLLHPNPWETCYFLEEERSFDNNMLYTYNIESISENSIDMVKDSGIQTRNILDKVFYVITPEMFRTDKADYGIRELANEFVMEYGVSQLSILIYVREEEKDANMDVFNVLQELYPNNYISDNQQIVLPNYAYTMKEFNAENTIDLSAEINDIVAAREMETLTLQKLDTLEAYVVEQIKKNPNINSLVYVGGGGNIVLRSIISYLCLKYNLKYGISEDSKYDWIAECGFTYLYGHMSFYERYKFVLNLPVAMKYRSHKILEVDCRYTGYTPPDIICAYDFDSCTKIETDYVLNEIKQEDMIDFRTLFKEQRAISSTTLQSSKYMKYEDYETDVEITERFIRMDPNRNINIRNSLLFYDRANDRRVLLLTRGEFVLHALVAAQSFFKSTRFDIEEKNFSKLFSHPLYASKAGVVPFVMDLKAILILQIFSYKPLYLSYYELALRWVSNLEDNIYNSEVVDLFSLIPLENIRKEKDARYFITSFGKPLSFDKNTQKNIVLYLTNKFMSGKEIPR